MKKEDFNAIIDFAIEKEQEAVQFYRDLQKMVKFKAQVDLLRELEDMEKGHIIILESIRKSGPGNLVTENIRDMKISNYLVESLPTQNMSYQDILITAMKREEASQKLYADMAIEYKGSDLSNLFLKLSAEESNHKYRFEKLYDEEILREN